MNHMSAHPEHFEHSEERDKQKEDLERWNKFWNHFLEIRKQGEAPSILPQETLDPEKIREKTEKNIENLRQTAEKGEGKVRRLDYLSVQRNNKIIRHGPETFNGYEDVPIDVERVAQTFGIDLQHPAKLVIQERQYEDSDDPQESHKKLIFYLADTQNKVWLEFQISKGPVIDPRTTPPYRQYETYTAACYVNPEKVKGLTWEVEKK